MPDRYDDELKKLRSVEVPDQWDDIVGRAGRGPVGGPPEVEGESRRTRWILLIATTAVVILIAGSVAIMRRNDNEVTETGPSASTTERRDEPNDRVAPSIPETLPTPQYSSCTLLVAGPAGAGFAFVPGPATPPLLSTDAMAGVNTTWHATAGLQTVEIHIPATAAGDLRGERTEAVNTTWGDATVWYAAYGIEDTVQIRVPVALPACGQWDVTVHGPDETANRDLAIEIASGTQ